jgi:23S rRNA (guanine745-N1)-methyltransferase
VIPLTAAAMPDILCPLCRQVLDRQPKAWRCPQNHSFDVAREGYVNLLPVQHKHSREPGDSAEMVAARREFLQAGHYEPLRGALLALLQPLGVRGLLDVGCGEGWYTSVLPRIAHEVTGLDIAKPAIQSAAKRFPGITWLVGSGAHLPFGEAALDVVISLFTPLQVGEMQRVLRPGGHVLLVTPAPDHLWSLREQLFEEVRPHEPDKFLAEFEAAFELQTRQELGFALSLGQADLRRLLLMTPYAWKAKPDKRAALEASVGLETQAAFSLLLFRRKG